MAGSPRSTYRRAGPGFFDEKSVPTAGWLLKKGGRKTGRFLTPWKKRWFIFTPATKELRYLEAPSAAKAKGTIMIVPEKTDVLVPEGGKGFCFVVSSLGGQKVNTLLQASNAEELSTWVTALRTAIGGGKPESKKAKPRRMSSMAAGATRGAAGGVIGGDRGSVRF